MLCRQIADLLATVQMLQEHSLHCACSRVTVQRVGFARKFYTIQEALNVARDGVRRHDQRCIDRVDILACDGALCMAEKRRDRRLSEA